MSEAPLLLATTTRAAWLLDTATGAATLIDEGRGVYYGISFSEAMVFIACRRAEVGGDRDSQRNEILCFDARLRPVGVLHPPMPVRDVHQICYHRGTLFICSTYDDAVVCYETETAAWSVWHPFGESWGEDRHHINSITVGDGGILLAGNRPSGWFASFTRDRVPRDGGQRPLGIGTHNVWTRRGIVNVCSSDEAALRSADGSLQPVVARGWVRGYAQDRDTAYVGVSQNLVRGVRERSDCMVVRIDSAGAIDRVFSFLGFGMLHDLRLVGRPDTSHNGRALQLRAELPADRTRQTRSTPISLDV